MAIDIAGKSFSLKERVFIGPNDQEVHPYGKNATGQLMYGKNGTMMVMVSHWEGRPTIGHMELTFAHTQLSLEHAMKLIIGNHFTGYFGMYTVEGNEITHHRIAGSMPEMSGTAVVRPADLRSLESGLELTLNVHSDEWKGEKGIGRVVWQEIV